MDFSIGFAGGVGARDHALDESLIANIRNYERFDEDPIDIRVRVGADLMVRR